MQFLSQQQNSYSHVYWNRQVKICRKDGNIYCHAWVLGRKKICQTHLLNSKRRTLSKITKQTANITQAISRRE